MPSKKEKSQDRGQRLAQWLQSNSPEWDDLKEEIKICLENANAKLKSQGCIERDFFAGKCAGVEEILSLETKFKNVILLDDKEVD